jgi:hypothetical protein
VADYRGAIEALLHRRAELERLIGAAIPGSAWEREVALLRCLRGIDNLWAVGLCAEIGDLRRFERAGRLMYYLTLAVSLCGACRGGSRCGGARVVCACGAPCIQASDLGARVRRVPFRVPLSDG